MALRQKITSVTKAAVGSVSVHPHSLGVTPDGVLILAKVLGSVSCTGYTPLAISVVGSASSMPFEAWVFVDHTIIN
jgi:hypothetical protein